MKLITMLLLAASPVFTAQMAMAHSPQPSPTFYSKAHRQSFSDSMQKVHYPSNGIQLAANIYYPPQFNP